MSAAPFSDRLRQHGGRNVDTSATRPSVVGTAVSNMDVLLRRRYMHLVQQPGHFVLNGAVDHQKDERMGAKSKIPEHTDGGKPTTTSSGRGQDLTFFLRGKGSQHQKEADSDSHSKEANHVTKHSGHAQVRFKTEHPARHGEESTASALGSGAEAAVVGEKRRRSGFDWVWNRQLRMKAQNVGLAQDGRSLICGLVRMGADQSTVASEEDRPSRKAASEDKPSVSKAMKIAKSLNFQKVRGCFRKRFHAASSRASRESKRVEVLKLARQVAGKNHVLPLSRDVVEGTAAALKESGMKSGSQYLTELKLLHVEAGYEIEAWLKRTLDQCRKALEREKGPIVRALEVRVETQAVDKLEKRSVAKGSPKDPGLMFVWAAVWMLREIEVRNMKVKDVLRNDQDRWAAIWLPTSKNDQQGEGVRRTLGCGGRTPCERCCPWRLASLVIARSGNTMPLPDEFLFKDCKLKNTTKRGVIASWKRTFSQGVSGHSPRRSGAMFYVRRGLPIQELAFLGRWRSSVVLTYAEEALQEKPVTLPAPHLPLEDTKAKDKPMVQDESGQKSPKMEESAPPHAELSLERAFDKPKNLWVVTKGKGWKNRPKHLVTKATWQLPIREWSTACGWAFAVNSSEFCFLTGTMVDEPKCQKCEAYLKGATVSER